MPVERTDMLELLKQQDKIANKAKDISGQVIGRQIKIPKSLQVFRAYLLRCLDAVHQAHGYSGVQWFTRVELWP